MCACSILLEMLQGGGGRCHSNFPDFFDELQSRLMTSMFYGLALGCLHGPYGMFETSWWLNVLLFNALLMWYIKCVVFCNYGSLLVGNGSATPSTLSPLSSVRSAQLLRRLHWSLISSPAWSWWPVHGPFFLFRAFELCPQHDLISFSCFALLVVCFVLVVVLVLDIAWCVVQALFIKRSASLFQYDVSWVVPHHNMIL